jgi:Tryptophan RNA-binding attenuator protein.
MQNQHSDWIEPRGAEYICVQALEDGVSIIGMTRGRDTRLHHTEKLDSGEVCVLQFTENTSAIKVRGNAIIYTRHGQIKSK